jgi:hypothetical protein
MNLLNIETFFTAIGRKLNFRQSVCFDYNSQLGIGLPSIGCWLVPGHRNSILSALLHPTIQGHIGNAFLCGDRDNRPIHRGQQLLQDGGLMFV